MAKKLVFNPVSGNFDLVDEGVSGNGIATRVAFWSSPNTLSSDNELYWDNTAKSLIIGGSGETGIVIGGATFDTHSIVHDDNAFSYQYFAHKHHDTDLVGPSIGFGRSRGSEGAETIVADGDVLARLDFLGHDGTDYAQAAGIQVIVQDPTPSSTSMGGRLSFLTTPQGAATPAVRMRINQDGRLEALGHVSINGVSYVWPSANAAGVLNNNGSGTLTWSGIAGGAGGVTGTGASGQVTFWNGTSTVTGVPYFLFDDGLQHLRVGSGSEFFDPGIISGESISGVNTLTINGVLYSSRLTGHVTSNLSAAGLWSAAYNGVSQNTGGLAIFSRSRGTYDSPSTIADDDLIGSLQFVGYDGTDYAQSANITTVVDDPSPGSSSMGATMNFATTPRGSQTPIDRLRLTHDANVEIVSGIVGTFSNVDLDLRRNSRSRISVFDGVVRISGIIEGGDLVTQDLILRPNANYNYHQVAGNTAAGVIRLLGRIRNTESFTPQQQLGAMIAFGNNWGTTNLPVVFPVALRTQCFGKYNYTTTGSDPGPGGILGLDIANIVEKTVSGIDSGSLTKWQSVETRAVWRYNAQGDGGTRIFGNYQAANTLDNVNNTVSGLATVDRYYGFGMSSFSPAPINYVGAGVTAGEFDAFWCPPINYSGLIGELYGLGVDDQAGLVSTRRAAVRSSLTRRVNSGGVNTSYGLWFPGSASNVVAGPIRIGDSDDPDPALSGIDVAGRIYVGNKLTIVASGVYNFIQGNGDQVSGPTLHTLFNAPGGFIRGYFLSGQVDFSRGNPAGASSGALFAFNTTFSANANSRTMSAFQGFANNAAFAPGGTFSGITNWSVRTLLHGPICGSLTGVPHQVHPRVSAVVSTGTILNPTGGSIIVDDWSGLHFNPPTILGTDRISRITAIEVGDLNVGVIRRSLWSKGTGVDLVNAGAGVFGANSGVSNSSVGLELNSATKAFLPSRLSATAAVASPIDGMIIYDSSSATHKARQGGAWVEFPGAGSSGPTVVTDVVTGSTDTIPNGSDLTCNTVTTTPGSGTDVLFIGSVYFDKNAATLKQVTLKLFKDGTEVNTADRYTEFNDAGSAANSERTITAHWAIASETAGSHTYTLRATEESGGANAARRLVSRLTVMY